MKLPRADPDHHIQRQAHPLFSVHCPAAGAEVLLGTRAIRSLHNTSEGIVTYFTCHCGDIGMMVTGQLAGRTRLHHPLRDADVPAVAECA